MLVNTIFKKLDWIGLEGWRDMRQYMHRVRSSICDILSHTFAHRRSQFRQVQSSIEI